MPGMAQTLIDNDDGDVFGFLENGEWENAG